MQRTGTWCLYCGYGQARVWDVYFLAAVPVLGAMAAQVEHSLVQTPGNISILQACRGFLLLIMLCFMFHHDFLRRGHFPDPRIYRIYRGFIYLVILSMLVILSREYLTTGLVTRGVIAHLQMLFWLCLWVMAVDVCKRPDDCRIVLAGLLLAGLLTSLSIIYSYASGAYNVRLMAQDVVSATGFYTSGKGLAGVLFIDAILVRYLLRNRSQLLSVCICAIFIAAGFLTYNRSGIVSFFAAVACMVAWAFLSRQARKATILAPVILLLAVSVGLALFLDSTSLRNRWADMTSDDPLHTGSGRGLIWTGALEHWLTETSLSEKVFGVGYGGMYDAMDDSIGLAIHTHSDLLDMLLVAGLWGVLLWLIIWGVLLHEIRMVHSVFRHEFILIRVAAATWFLQGLFTGGFFGVTAMPACVVTITCLCRINLASPEERLRGATPRSRPVIPNRRYDPCRCPPVVQW